VKITGTSTIAGRTFALEMGSARRRQAFMVRALSRAQAELSMERPTLPKMDVSSGQESFLTYDLMQCGSVYGHGADLGPDFTADYLHRLALEMRRAYGDTAEAAERVRRELRENRYDPATDVLTWPSRGCISHVSSAAVNGASNASKPLHIDRDVRRRDRHVRIRAVALER
jgi:hypothetical protein